MNTEQFEKLNESLEKIASSIVGKSATDESDVSTTSVSERFRTKFAAKEKNVEVEKIEQSNSILIEIRDVLEKNQLENFKLLSTLGADLRNNTRANSGIFDSILKGLAGLAGLGLAGAAASKLLGKGKDGKDTKKTPPKKDPKVTQKDPKKDARDRIRDNARKFFGGPGSTQDRDRRAGILPSEVRPPASRAAPPGYPQYPKVERVPPQPPRVTTPPRAAAPPGPRSGIPIQGSQVKVDKIPGKDYKPQNRVRNVIPKKEKEKPTGKSVFGKTKSIVSKAARFIPGIGQAAALGLSIYAGKEGYDNTAENLGIEGREPTAKEKIISSLAGIAESFSLNIIDQKEAARRMAKAAGISEEQASEALKGAEPENKVDQVAPTPPDMNPSSNVNDTTIDNQNMIREKGTSQQISPTIINNNTTNNQGSSVVPLPGGPRFGGQNSIERKANQSSYNDLL